MPSPKERNSSPKWERDKSQSKLTAYITPDDTEDNIGSGNSVQRPVASATLPGSMGEFTVLRNHATLLATLVPGFIRYKTESGEELSCEVGGGIADIDNNVISVCVY